MTIRLRFTALGLLAIAGCRTPLGPSGDAPAPFASQAGSGATTALVQHTESLPPPVADAGGAGAVAGSQNPPPAPPSNEILPASPFRSVQQDMTLPPAVRELDGRQGENVPPLSLAAVTESVYYAYPGLEAALREFDIAAGREQAAVGKFDLKLKGTSENEVLGFYQRYKNAVKFEQPLWSGGEVYGQYRLGRGSYPTWDGLETNDGGEFKVGLLKPLLQNYHIDGRRADVMKATLRRQQVDPSVQALLLELVRDAADAYWSWVAAGQSYDIQRELLSVTIERNEVYEGRVDAGDLPRLELVQNQRLIASREAKMVESERKLQQSAIKLSLFLRDDAGQPVVPSPAALPTAFPEPVLPNAEATQSAVNTSLMNRPELRELDIVRQQAEVDLALGQNLHLPDLTAALDAAQDVGAPTKKKDKTPLQMQAGLYFDVPLQRNIAHGKIREARGKLAQIAAKRRLVENKIVVEVQDSLSALQTSYNRYLRAKENTQLAEQLVRAERQRFDAQDSDLLRVAFQEAAAIEAALTEIDALADFFRAEAAYRAATAAPLDLSSSDQSAR